jgi:hypothetical protein
MGRVARIDVVEPIRGPMTLTCLRRCSDQVFAGLPSQTIFVKNTFLGNDPIRSTW